MMGSSPQRIKSTNGNDQGGGQTIARASIFLLLIAILLTTFLAIRFIELPGASTNDDTPVLLAETGCFDMDLLPAESAPPVSRDVAERDVRENAATVEPRTGEGPDGDRELGELIWADYGVLAPGTEGRIESGQAWVLVFELERDASWWRRLTIQDDDARYSVIYRPETGEIVAACGDEA